MATWSSKLVKSLTEIYHNIQCWIWHLGKGHTPVYGNQAAKSFPVISVFIEKVCLSLNFSAAVSDDLNDGTNFLRNLDFGATSLIPPSPRGKGWVFGLDFVVVVDWFGLVFVSFWFCRWYKNIPKTTKCYLLD